MNPHPRESSFRREGKPGAPHDHSEMVAALRAPADSTDGIEIVSSGLPAPFDSGPLVAMNSGARNFLLFRFPDLRR